MKKRNKIILSILIAIFAILFFGGAVIAWLNPLSVFANVFIKIGLGISAIGFSTVIVFAIFGAINWIKKDD